MGRLSPGLAAQPVGWAALSIRPFERHPMSLRSSRSDFPGRRELRQEVMIPARLSE